MLGNKMNGLLEYNSSRLKYGNILCKFKSNVMFFVYPKHKETTEDISVLVSPIYKYAMTSFLRTKPVGGSGVPASPWFLQATVNQSNFTDVCWRCSFRVRVLGVKVEQTSGVPSVMEELEQVRRNVLQETEPSFQESWVF